MIPMDEEVHGGPDEEEEDDELQGDEPSFTRSGLHRVLNSSEGTENTKLFIITETRLRDLAVEARSSCHSCHQPLEVSIHHAGTSAHLTWVRFITVFYGWVFVENCLVQLGDLGFCMQNGW